MAGRTIKVSPNIRMVLHNEEFERVRKTGAMIGLLHLRGEEWVERLNNELHAAQAKRRQPVEDGYVYHVSDRGTRARLYVVAATARAQAHERAHSSILRLMETTNYDVKTRGQLEKAAKKAAAKVKRKEARQRAAAANLSPHERTPHNLDES
jgi:hypothetical protein